MRDVRNQSLAIVLALAWACNPGPDSDPYSPQDYQRFQDLDAGRHTLFGLPPENGPIEESCCMPTCAYLEDGQTKTWTAPRYTLEEIQALRDDWVLAEPWPVFEGNDFRPTPPEDAKETWVCGVLPRPDLQVDGEGPMPYDLVSYETRAEAEKAGAMVTHAQKCGACSSLWNLAVYIANPNLTEPVRRCGITGLIDRDLSRLACIASLGFDLPCAQAWDINTRNTQKECLKVCGEPGSRKAPGNKAYECDPEGFVPEDIKLVNDCLACDEEYSLRLFRAAAGRARRNSGLPSPICRTCEDVERIEHRYPVPGR
ncbi:MAG TPA: hypothetical protein VLS88_02980 [Polyangiales bacterium]|nr:hypothetical protein [Polyangiales bacterium]